MDFIQRTEYKERALARQDYPGLHNWIDRIMQQSRKRSRPTYLTKKEQEKRKRLATAAIKQRAIRHGFMNTRIGGYVGRELKYVDQSVSGTTLTDNTWTVLDPSLNCLNGIVQGDGKSERDGRNYIIKSVHINGYLKLDAEESSISTVSDLLARVAIIHDGQTNNGSPTATDVYEDGDINSFRNLEWIRRFTVCKEKKIRIPCSQSQVNEGTTNAFAHGSIVIPFKMNINITSPLWVNTNGTTGSVSSITDNSFHFMVCALTDSNSPVRVYYTSRVRFCG